MARLRLASGRLMPLWLMLCVLGFAACGESALGQTRHTLVRDGGVRLVLRAACLPDAPACDLAKQRDAAVAVLSRRITGNTDVPNPVVRVDGAADIVVELPGVSDEAQITSVTTLVTEAGGTVEILDTRGVSPDVGANMTGKTCRSACDAGQYRVVFTGAQMNPGRIAVQQDTQHGGVWLVEFAFAGAAKKQFADYTASHIGQALVFTLNDVVIASPFIASAIDDAGQVSGLSEAQARQVAHDLKVGALPVALSIVSTERVTPGSKQPGN